MSTEVPTDRLDLGFLIRSGVAILRGPPPRCTSKRLFPHINVALLAVFDDREIVGSLDPYHNQSTVSRCFAELLQNQTEGGRQSAGVLSWHIDMLTR